MCLIIKEVNFMRFEFGDIRKEIDVTYVKVA
jgi:hypothetical protein